MNIFFSQGIPSILSSLSLSPPSLMFTNMCSVSPVSFSPLYAESKLMLMSSETSFDSVVHMPLFVTCQRRTTHTHHSDDPCTLYRRSLSTQNLSAGPLPFPWVAHTMENGSRLRSSVAINPHQLFLLGPLAAQYAPPRGALTLPNLAIVG